jgi:hypothetical protein
MPAWNPSGDKMKRNLGKDGEARFEAALKEAGIGSFHYRQQ